MTGTDQITQGLIAFECSSIAQELLGAIGNKENRQGDYVRLEAEYLYRVHERLVYFSRKLKGEL